MELEYKDLQTLCEEAKAAKYALSLLSSKEKEDALLIVAEEIIAEKENILMANAKDIAEAAKNGMAIAMIDRLKLSEDRIYAMAEGVKQVASLPDPVGEILGSFERPNGLKIEKVRVPLGVIGIIYESRPNVTADAFALCFRSGNVVILKGGKDAIHSNKAITLAIHHGLERAGVSTTALGLISDTDRETTAAFMKMNNYVDVLIPRGGAGLINFVKENARIPVIETGTGNCHVYIDASAKEGMARDIIVNAKTQRLGVCNAIESLVVHRDAMPILKEVARALQEKAVTIRGDEDTVLLLDCEKATEDDYGREYLDLLISVKTVDSIDEAIAHINKYSTHHSECIVTENQENADKFLREIDSACVYHNASTRFTDGFEFGFGAEIGISTQMLHARGPMGLPELTTYKYRIHGNGQIRG